MQLTEQGKVLWQEIELTGIRGAFGDDEAMSFDIEAAEKWQGELTSRGVGYPTISEFMDLINAGNQPGYTVATQQEDLVNFRQRLTELLAGKIQGDDVIGAGNGGDRAAEEWLGKQILHLEKSISLGGVGLSINISHYISYLRNIASGSHHVEMAGLKALFSDNKCMSEELALAASKQESLTARGIAHPTMTEYMRLVDGYRQSGYGLAYQRNELILYQQELRGVIAGRVIPDKVISRKQGGKEAAIAWLNEKIQELEKSIAVGGLGLSHNIHIYRLHLASLVEQLSS